MDKGLETIREDKIMTKKALITGITGRDGAYLARFLEMKDMK